MAVQGHPGLSSGGSRCLGRAAHAIMVVGLGWGWTGALGRLGPTCGSGGCLGGSTQAQSCLHLCYWRWWASVWLRRWVGPAVGVPWGARSSPYLCLII